MKISFVLKFKDGMIATLPPYDAYDFHGDGDLFRLLVKGKLDSKEIEINGIPRNYRDLSSFEIVFIE